MSRYPRWFAVFVGGMVGPVWATAFLGVPAKSGVVVVVTVLAIGVLYILNSESRR